MDENKGIESNGAAHSRDAAMPLFLDASSIHMDFSDFGFDRTDDQWLESLRHAGDALPPGRLGEYELIGEVGRGGQGVVYQARQPGTHRQIAIKRLWAGSLATPSMRARFEREIEAASLLNHPNIVRILASETIDGQPTLAMEWIDGVPIDRWAAGPLTLEPSGDDDPDDAPFGIARPLRERLEVFARVGDAVSHAHQRGVLHRDLKPSNILVDADDQPHVLDFGLAKFSDAIAGRPDANITITQASGFLGTPAYASPEQVSGSLADVDVRSDVYSLGVVLYQMLTGELPHGEARSLAEVFDAIRLRDPRRPSSLRRELNDEIDAIVLTSLEKDPARRYQSVDALAMDVRRFLNNETVLAHPPHAMYQARKFIARHRLVVASLIAVVGALAIALGAVSIALLRVASAQRDTRAAERTSGTINDFLNQMLATVDPDVTRGPDVRVSAILDEAAAALDDGALREAPLAEARVRQTIGESYFSLGLFEQAQAQLERSVRIIREGAHEPDAAYVSSLMRLAEVRRRRGEYQQAIETAREAHETARRLSPPQSLVEVQAGLAHVRALISADQREHSAAVFRQIHDEVLARSAGKDTDELAQVLMASVGHDDLPDEIERRVAQRTEGLAMHRRLHANDDDRVATALVNNGYTLTRLNRFDEARLLLDQAIDIRRRLYGDDHPSTAIARYNLAIYHQTRGEFADAETLLLESLDTCMRKLGPNNTDTCRMKLRLGLVLMAKKEHQAAESLIRETKAALERNLPVGSIYYEQAQRALARTLWVLDRPAEAETEYRASLEFYQANIHPIRPYIPRQTMGNLAKLCDLLGKTDEAEQWRARLQSIPAEATSLD